MRIDSLFPLIGQLRGADRALIGRDVSAGLTTAVMLVPQAMAYALLAGLEPVVGLYAATVPVIVYALLGTSRELAVGPVAMVSLLTATAVAPLAGDDPVAYAALAALLALLAGGLQIAMGLLRLGALVKLLSRPVLAGFTSAAALIIGLSQLKHILGVSIPRSHHVHTIVLEAAQRIGEANATAVVLGLGTLAVLAALKRVAPRVPRFLLVVAGGTLATWGLSLDIAIVGAVPAGLPAPSLPALDTDTILALLPAALTIALVGFMESIVVARSYARRSGNAVDADRELLALGGAAVAAGLFGGYPVTGGFSRTAVNAQAGARTGLAGLITGVVVVVTLLVLTPLFHFLPKTVLAAIILSAVLGLIELHEAKHLWKTCRSDLALMAVTFAATLLIGIEPGILVGVGASVAWFIWKNATPHVAVLGRLPGTTVYRNIERYPDAAQHRGIVALRIDAPLFFANSLFLGQTVERLIDEAPQPVRHVVLDAKGIGSIDSSAVASLGELEASLHARDITLWMAGVRGPVRDMMAGTGLLDRMQGRLVERAHQAIDRIESNRVSMLSTSTVGASACAS